MALTLDEVLSLYPFPRVIDNTLLEDWKTCPHKFFRHRVQGLVPADFGEPGTAPKLKTNIHLHFGGCMARGLEITRREYAEGAGHGEALALGAAAIVEAWDAAGELPAPRSRSEEIKTLDNCILAHAGYFREWDLDDPLQQVMLVNDKPLVELSGARIIPGCLHPISNEPLLYAGRFDAILDRFGRAVGLDDKTTGGNVEGQSWAETWSLRGQFTGYVWLAAAWGYHIEEFVIHGIQPLKTKCNYAEALEVRPRWMVERWLAQLQADVGTMCHQYLSFIEQAVGQVPEDPFSHPFGQRFGEACHHFNSPCLAAPLCKEPNPEDFLDRYLVQRWDPLRVRGEE